MPWERRSRTQKYGSCSKKSSGGYRIMSGSKSESEVLRRSGRCTGNCRFRPSFPHGLALGNCLPQMTRRVLALPSIPVESDRLPADRRRHWKRACGCEGTPASAFPSTLSDRRTWLRRRGATHGKPAPCRRRGRNDNFGGGEIRGRSGGIPPRGSPTLMTNGQVHGKEVTRIRETRRLAAAHMLLESSKLARL